MLLFVVYKCLPICMFVHHVPAWYSQRPGEDAGSPITGQTVVGSLGDARNTVLLKRVRVGRGHASLIEALERQRQREQGSQPGLHTY